MHDKNVVNRVESRFIIVHDKNSVNESEIIDACFLIVRGETSRNYYFATVHNENVLKPCVSDHARRKRHEPSEMHALCGRATNNGERARRVQ